MTQIPGAEAGAIVVLGIFIVGLVWDASKNREQLREVRRWRRLADKKLDRIMYALKVPPIDDDEDDDE